MTEELEMEAVKCSNCQKKLIRDGENKYNSLPNKAIEENNELKVKVDEQHQEKNIYPNNVTLRMKLKFRKL